jgi:hypothetical protein
VQISSEEQTHIERLYTAFNARDIMEGNYSPHLKRVPPCAEGHHHRLALLGWTSSRGQAEVISGPMRVTIRAPKETGDWSRELMQ